MSTPAPVVQHKTRLPRAAQRQVDEANALLESLTTKPGEPPAGAPAPVVEPAPVAAAEPVPAAPVAAAEPAPVAPEPDFKQMYGVLKGKYDKEIPELRVRLTDEIEKRRQTEILLEQATERLRTAPVAKPPKAGELPAPAGFSEEEMREYGPEFFNVVARRAQEVIDAQLGPLRQELETTRAQLGQGARVEAERSRANVLLALDTEVPNWAAMNTDPGFLAWLGSPDVFSGKMKRELLTQAFEANDAARVVRFFKAFQEDSARQSAPAARQAAVDPGTLVAPGVTRSAGAPAAAPGGDDRVYTQQEIADFYTAVRMKKVPPAEKERMERIFTRAAAEGRVR